MAKINFNKKEVETLAKSTWSPAYYYDMIVSSGEIKKVILARLDELEVDLNLVLKEAGITPHAFKKAYLRHPDPVSTPALRQSQLIKLLETLGVKLKIRLEVESKENVRTEHLRYRRE